MAERRSRRSSTVADRTTRTSRRPASAAVQPAVHKASTVLFAEHRRAARARTWKEKTGYTYGLHGTPTTFIARGAHRHARRRPADAADAERPGGDHAGRHAALLKSGDEVLIPDNAYGPAKELARNELARWGIAHRFYDPMDAESLRAALDAGDAPGLARAAGLGDDGVPRPAGAAAAAARAPGVVVALDNTWGAGLAFDAVRRSAARRGARRRHLDAGPDQVPLGRRRPADGRGDDARRGAAPSASRRRTCAWAGASAPTTSRRCCARCRR